MLLSYTQGLLTAMGLIIAIGAQNVLVLSQGLKRQHQWLVAAVCTFFDLLFITLGVLGLAAVLNTLPLLVTALRWLGAAYLLYLAWQAARRLQRRQSLQAITQGPSSRRQILTAALAVTVLNPQVLLETAFIIGTLADQHGPQRWYFAAGAMTTSALWFFGLSALAAWLAPTLARPRIWQAIDLFTAVLMTLLALQLLHQ